MVIVQVKKTEQESCAIAKMTARCADKSKQTATPPPKITWLSVDRTLLTCRCWLLNEHFLPKISPRSPGSMSFGLRKAKMLGQLFAQLVSKIFNVCGRDAPTSQTDRQTDRHTTCDRKTALCITVLCTVKNMQKSKIYRMLQMTNNNDRVNENGTGND